MNLKTKVASTALLAMSLLSFSAPVFAGVRYGNDDWKYGSNNNPWDWGAFSNYNHYKRFHWSSVKREKTGRKVSAEDHAGYYSRAFINTNLGEYVYFNCGLYNG